MSINKLIPRNENDKWGYVDVKGCWVINPQFINAYPFVDGLARIPTIVVEGANDDVETKFGYIDESGNWVIKPQFQQACDFVDGIACVRYNSMWGFIPKVSLGCIVSNCGTQAK